MPCAQFEALEQRRQAWRDVGIDSDEETIQDKDNDDDSDDPQEAPVPLEARICTTAVDMFKHVLLFSQGVAEALYDDQMLTTLDVLQDLTRGQRTWTPNLQAFCDPSQAVCVLGKAHVADFKRCR